MQLRLLRGGNLKESICLPGKQVSIHQFPFPLLLFQLVCPSHMMEGIGETEKDPLSSDQVTWRNQVRGFMVKKYPAKWLVVMLTRILNVNVSCHSAYNR